MHSFIDAFSEDCQVGVLVVFWGADTEWQFFVVGMFIVFFSSVPMFVCLFVSVCCLQYAQLVQSYGTARQKRALATSQLNAKSSGDASVAVTSALQHVQEKPETLKEGAAQGPLSFSSFS